MTMDYIHNYGLHNYGLHNYGLHNYGLHNYGLHNYGAVSHFCLFSISQITEKGLILKSNPALYF
jgi:hypothetical protein